MSETGTLLKYAVYLSGLDEVGNWSVHWTGDSYITIEAAKTRANELCVNNHTQVFVRNAGDIIYVATPRRINKVVAVGAMIEGRGQ